MFRVLLDKERTLPHGDYLSIARKGISEIPREVLAEDLGELLSGLAREAQRKK